MKTQKPDALLGTLKARFAKHKQRHAGIAWAEVLARLEASPRR